MPDDPANTARVSRSWHHLAPVVGVMMLLLLTLPFILSGYDKGRAAWDERHFHRPAIQTLADTLPNPDYSNYTTATTPLFHMVLAATTRLSIESPVALRVISLVLFSVPLVAGLGVLLSRVLPSRPMLAAALLLPLIFSTYTHSSAAWLLPDNAGWLFVLLTLASAYRASGCASPVRWLAAAGVMLFATVLTRQIHLWAVAPIWLAAWMAPAPTGDEPGFFKPTRVRVLRASAAIAVTLPSAAVIVYFHNHWGGLVPPRFQTNNQAFSSSLPAFLLLEIAILSVPLSPFLWETMTRLTRLNVVFIGAGVVLALVFAVLPETTWSFEAGRASGWWNLVRAGPVLGDHTSVVLLLGAPAGAVALGLWLLALSARDRVFFGVLLLGFGAAQFASANVWQRYHEPLLLMLLPLAAARIAREQSPNRALARLRVAAPVLLAVALAGISANTLRKGDRNPDKEAPDVFGVMPAASPTPENPVQKESRRLNEP